MQYFHAHLAPSLQANALVDFAASQGLYEYAPAYPEVKDEASLCDFLQRQPGRGFASDKLIECFDKAENVLEKLERNGTIVAIINTSSKNKAYFWRETSLETLSLPDDLKELWQQVPLPKGETEERLTELRKRLHDAGIAVGDSEHERANKREQLRHKRRRPKRGMGSHLDMAEALLAQLQGTSN
ncbi:MAG: hypothetical protein MHM6MM_000474 [Cercozoa sp. M6MM]